MQICLDLYTNLYSLDVLLPEIKYSPISLLALDAKTGLTLKILLGLGYHLLFMIMFNRIISDLADLRCDVTYWD